MVRTLGLAVIAFAVLLSAIVMPADADRLFMQNGFEYKEYVVKQGDTLWSITKNELLDGFQWPMVWQENLRINNPDLIYPGQIINIPIRVVSAEAVTEPKPAEPVAAPASTEPEPVAAPSEPVASEAPAPSEPDDATPADPKPTSVSAPVAAPAPAEPASAEPASAEPETERYASLGHYQQIPVRKVHQILSRQSILEAGYISHVPPDSGTITGSPSGRIAFGSNDILYIDTANEAEIGKLFYVVRQDRPVSHPDTDEDMGWVFKVVGTVRVIEAGTTGLRTEVVEAFDLLSVGDTLDHYFEVIPPFASNEPPMPDIGGYIVAARDTRLINAEYDVVFIDKGRKQNVEEGDIFITYLRNTNDSLNGVLQVVLTRENTSMAVIRASSTEVTNGDLFSQATKDILKNFHGFEGNTPAEAPMVGVSLH